MAQVRAGGPSLLPSPLTGALAKPLPAPVRVRAGRVTAYAYFGAIQRRPRTLFNVYVVPTTRGVAAIACSVGTSDLLLVPSRSDCERALAGLRLTTGRMLTPRRDTAFALALAAAIDGLAAARRGGRRVIATAASPSARSRAATRVAAAYRAAARSLGPYSSGTPTELGTIGSLSQLAGAYDALALGAALDDAAAFDSAASEIQAAEPLLEDRLEGWQAALRR